jgi:predicted Zn-dependent protease with MMP-like domain
MRDLAKIREERAKQRQFERLVVETLDQLPEQIQAALDNVEVVIEDEPTREQLGSAGVEDEYTLFGLYQGIPLTQRGQGYSMVLPDKITIFRGPIERACRTPRSIAEQVRITVIHELAHHVGIDEDRLDDLGWR